MLPLFLLFAHVVRSVDPDIGDRLAAVAARLWPALMGRAVVDGADVEALRGLLSVDLDPAAVRGVLDDVDVARVTGQAGPDVEALQSLIETTVGRLHLDELPASVSPQMRRSAAILPVVMSVPIVDADFDGDDADALHLDDDVADALHLDDDVDPLVEGLADVDDPYDAQLVLAAIADRAGHDPADWWEDLPEIDAIVRATTPRAVRRAAREASATARRCL